MTEENKDLLNNQVSHDDDTDAHDFDGITELNNKAPVWIVVLFIVTIGFSGVYAIKYFGYPGNEMDQTSEYNRKVEEFDQKLADNKAANMANKGEISLDDIMANGAKLYAEKGCLACHGVNGEGNNIGPNLTDNFWINGCSLEDIEHIIKEGNPMKGMTPYKTMMSEEQINHLSQYIKNSMVGSNPANGKEPQGEECIN